MRYLLLGLALVVLAVMAVAAGLVAFGDSDDEPFVDSALGTPAGMVTPDALTAEDVLESAAEAARAVQSFHFVLTHENGTTPLPLNLGLETAEGDVVVPDRLAAEVDADAVGINVAVEIIGIGDQTWVTNPFTRQWEPLPGTDIRDFANPAALLSDLLPAINDATLSDGSAVEGVQTHLISGTIASDALASALGIAEPGRNIDVEAWVGQDDSLPRRIRLTGALTAAESPDVVRQVVISRFDEPVEIMPPE